MTLAGEAPGRQPWRGSLCSGQPLENLDSERGFGTVPPPWPVLKSVPGVPADGSIELTALNTSCDGDERDSLAHVTFGSCCRGGARHHP